MQLAFKFDPPPLLLFVFKFGPLYVTCSKRFERLIKGTTFRSKRIIDDHRVESSTLGICRELFVLWDGRAGISSRSRVDSAVTSSRIPQAAAIYKAAHVVVTCGGDYNNSNNNIPSYLRWIR